MAVPGDASRTARGTVLIDLSLEISHGMLVAANTNSFTPGPIIVPLMSHDQSLEQGLGVPGDPLTYATNIITMLDHVGTHVDALYHVNEKGLKIDEMPLDWFTGKAVCLDLRHVPDLGDIDVVDLERAEKESGLRIDGHIVLMCTGFHARHWPRREVVTLNPGVTAAATHWLADRGSRVHGVEGPSTDKGGTQTFSNHRVCRDRGLFHYEWLVNLEALVGKGEFTFTGYPLKWLQGTGSPVRAVAELPA
jgi:kynurenine formamidase